MVKHNLKILRYERYWNLALLNLYPFSHLNALHLQYYPVLKLILIMTQGAISVNNQLVVTKTLRLVILISSCQTCNNLRDWESNSRYSSTLGYKPTTPTNVP